MGNFLERIASAEPAPGGGATAAMAVSLAASLTEMAVRLSEEQLDNAEELVSRSGRLRQETARLARKDGVVYGRVIEAQRAGVDIRAALSDAADVPLAVAEAGTEVAGMAVRLAEDGNPNLEGDAITAALLTEAGTRAAATLVGINLRAAGIEDARLDRAHELLSAATIARQAMDGIIS